MNQLERAEKHLEAWYAAELAVSTGQSYSIGSRSVTRVNLPEIRKQITFWQREVSRLNGKGNRRVFRAVPRDI